MLGSLFKNQRMDARRLVRGGALILAGSFIYAFGVDCFLVPNGLAAGGLTGLATIFHAIAKDAGIYLPVGLQTILMNVLLLTFVELKTHDRSYIALSIAGILAAGFFTDLLAAYVPNLTNGDLLLSALWGGVVSGVGIGVVFLSGGNTGGADIICQLLYKKTGIPLGVATICIDCFIVACSIPVFSLGNALYAIVAMFISGKAIDAIVDGPRSERAAYIISNESEKIANEIMYKLGRGCTELTARGTWSGKSRRVLFCVLGRSETMRLKDIVSRNDADAIVVISEVHEAFGEGFKRLDI